jgi:hypothetical protein
MYFFKFMALQWQAQEGAQVEALADAAGVSVLLEAGEAAEVASVEGAVVELPPPLKSVAYQPEPFN